LNKEAKNPPLSDFLIAGSEGRGDEGGEGGEGEDGEGAGGAPAWPGQPGGGGVGLGAVLPGGGLGQKDSTILKIPV